MSRSLMVGMTDYSHQSLDDIEEDLEVWIQGLQETQELFSQNLEKLQSNKYWKTVVYDFQALIGYTLKFYKTSEKELQEILEEIRSGEIQPNHVVRLRSMAETGDELNLSYGRVWHREYKHKEYDNPDFRLVEDLYRDGRGMVADMLDLSNLAARLEDFVGRKGRTKPTTSPQFDSTNTGSNLELGIPKPIRILFLAANPKDTLPLRLDAEMRAIDQALQQAKFRNQFEIHQHWAVKVADIQNLLLRYKPHIVHFSGHGSGASEIILEDSSGNSSPVSMGALSQLFSVLKDNIKCVVLNACYSEQQAQAIAQNIDCVIGMSNAIGDEAATSFSAAFYQALGFGRDIKTAFDLGCVQIDLESLNEQDTPRLLADVIDPKTIVFAGDS